MLSVLSFCPMKSFKIARKRRIVFTQNIFFRRYYLQCLKKFFSSPNRFNELCSTIVLFYFNVFSLLNIICFDSSIISSSNSTCVSSTFSYKSVNQFKILNSSLSLLSLILHLCFFFICSIQERSEEFYLC